ncbi:hypothetical protein KZ770_07405 [Escherichia coli]|nr:hypothetical protein [Escherichia coli]
MIYVIMHEISVILIDYAVDKKQAGTIDPSHRRIELKMAGFGLFSRRGLSDYAVTEISQYVWW